MDHIIMEFVTLSNGVKMPLNGFGVFRVAPGQETEQSVTEALQAGYRLIDTAAAYMNEEGVGSAIKKSGIPRSELFIVTKLWHADHGYESAKKAFERSLNKLGLDYIDLYLVHQPIGDYYSAWRALEEIYESGKAKAIGVSNFYPGRLTDLCMHARIKPMVDQFETHPFYAREDMIANMREFGVVPMAWGPLAQGRHNIFTNATLEKIAKAHNKSISQVALRWNTQRGVIVIPKSTHKERIIENLNIFDFKLTDEEMKEISSLDTGKSEIVDHNSAQFVKFIMAYKVD